MEELTYEQRSNRSKIFLIAAIAVVLIGSAISAFILPLKGEPPLIEDIPKSLGFTMLITILIAWELGYLSFMLRNDKDDWLEGKLYSFFGTIVSFGISYSLISGIIEHTKQFLITIGVIVILTLWIFINKKIGERIGE